MPPKLRKVLRRPKIAIHVLRGRPVAYRLDLNEPLSFRPYPHNVLIYECSFTDCTAGVRIRSQRVD